METKPTLCIGKYFKRGPHYSDTDSTVVA